MAPYITIAIFSIIGLIFWGLEGLIVGFIIGRVVTFVLGMLAWPITKFLDIGPMKKKNRIAIAQNFIIENRELIESIPKFKNISNIKLVNQFSKYINEIFNSAIEIKDPIKKHNYDLNTFKYKINFLRGGLEIWAKSFDNPEESGLMSYFVIYCSNAIFSDNI